MILAIVGGRYYNERAKFKREVDAISAKHPQIHTIISGGAPGADALAKQYAITNKLKYNPLAELNYPPLGI